VSTPVIAFFNNKGGVGKTSMVYHLSWMYADLGLNLLAADLDPQANLTAAFLDEERLEELWDSGRNTRTVFGAVEPLLRGTGDISAAHIEPIDEGLGLLVGDLALSRFEDPLSEVWPKCNDRDERAFRVISALWRILQQAASQSSADAILVDLGPNLGALNRAALISADFVVVPLSPDLFSLQGLRNLGPRLRDWRNGWQERLSKRPLDADLELPRGQIRPVGYIVLQHSVRMDRPVKAYERWIARIPEEYRSSVLQSSLNKGTTVEDDPHCLALLRHYRSLMPMAQEARKPMFHLKPADGAIGAHFQAVQVAHKDFEALARKIAGATGLTLS
jgi:cellulose biosynthesis protein BcsQ